MKRPDKERSPVVEVYRRRSLFTGFAICSALIAAVSRVQETVPAGRLTEGMAVFSTGLMAGVAPGAALVGWVVDRYGASSGYWVPTTAGFVGALLAFATSALRRPATTLEADGEPVEVQSVRQG